MWSFGICFIDYKHLTTIINSIKNQKNLHTDNFEIILIGPSNPIVKSL